MIVSEIHFLQPPELGVTGTSENGRGPTSGSKRVQLPTFLLSEFPNTEKNAGLNLTIINIAGHLCM